MVPDSPFDALGSHAPSVRDLLVEVLRNVHDRFAEAHLVSGSKYATGFGSQWRDLLDEAHDALTERGFQSHTLAPGGHKVGVVSDSLVYVWRVPDDPNAVRDFASSPTRQSGFVALPPDPMLWEPNLVEQESEATADSSDLAETAALMAHSTPRQLQSVEWAVAVLDDDGKVQLRGHEAIWEPELVADVSASGGVESFDSGAPVAPVVELQQQERPGTDA
jgi:hypothetical protein